MRARGRAAVAVTALLLVTAACSSSSKSATPSSSSTTSPPRTPKVAAATMEGPIAGDITLPADPRPLDLPGIGYTQEELLDRKSVV